jgi:hypothetical protein
MKKPISASNKVPRLNSLLHRLQKAVGPEDEPSYLDQLMIFLEDPPPAVTDRWKEGAAMCAAWGFTCSCASVWRLYRAHAVAWRAQLALEAALADGESLEALQQKAERMIALRTCELLASPDTPPAVIVGLARLGLRQKVLDLARQKQKHHERTSTERALTELGRRAGRDRYSKYALAQLKDALNGKPKFKLPPPITLPPFFNHVAEIAKLAE